MRRRGGSREISNLAPVKHKVSFEAGVEFVAKLEEVKAVLSNKLGAGAGLEEVLGVCMEVCLEKYCPKRKVLRRVEREVKTKTQSQSQKKSAGGRYISAGVRDEVLRRDQYQCSFVGTDGRRCGCRQNLQIDHIVPFAVGGESESKNLRVLCHAHNQFEARQAFGRGVVHSCIERARDA